MKKSKIFARKIISVILAVLMAASTFTGVVTVYAKSTDDNHDSKLAANFMAWAETTDNQTAEALLDWVDETLQKAGLAPIVFSGNYVVVNININGHLDSIDGVLDLVRQVGGLLDSYGGLLGGDIKNINLSPLLSLPYIESGDGIISKCNKSYRAKNDAKDIVMALAKTIYWNSNDNTASGHTNKNIIGQFIKGKLDLGSILSGIVDVYGLIGGIGGLDMWAGYQSNLVYNLLANVILSFSGWYTDAEIKDYKNYLQGNGGTKWNFDEQLFAQLTDAFMNKLALNITYARKKIVDPDTGRITFEPTDCSQARYVEIKAWLNKYGKGINDDTVAEASRALGYDDQLRYEPTTGNVYLFRYGNEKLSLTTSTKVYDAVNDALKLAWNSAILPTISLLRVNNDMDWYEGHGGNFDNQFYYWAQSEGLIDENNWEAVYTMENVEAYAAAKYVEYGCASPADMIEKIKKTFDYDRNIVDEPTYTWRDVEKNNNYVTPEGRTESILFGKLRYSPLADKVFNMQTGPINLYFMQTGFPNLVAFVEDYFNNVSKYGNIINAINNLLVAAVKDIFPDSENIGLGDGENNVITNISRPNLITTGTSPEKLEIAQAIATNLMRMLEYGANVTDENLLSQFYNKNGESGKLTSSSLSEANVEEAMVPLAIACIQVIADTKSIHREDWDYAVDAEGVAFVALREYLSYSLPKKNYDQLVKIENGKYVATKDFDTSDGPGASMYLDVILPMARDAVGYLLNSIVPCRDKNGNIWNVYATDPATDTTTIFEILNSVVCYYASMDEFNEPTWNTTASKTYGKGVAALLGVVTSTGACNVTNTNTLWQNFDNIANSVWPVLGIIQYGSKEEAKKHNGFNSYEFLYEGVILPLLEISGDRTALTNSQKQVKGITKVLEQLLVMFTTEPVVTKGIDALVYDEVVASLVNSIFGKRTNSQLYARIIPTTDDMKAGGLNSATPFDTLVSSTVFAYSKGYDENGNAPNNNENGVLGNLLSNLYGFLGGNAEETNATMGAGTWQGLMFVVKAVSYFIPGFLPQLKDHQFNAASVSVNDPSRANIQTGASIGTTTITLSNNASGLNRFYKNESGKIVADDRYFVVAKNLVYDGPGVSMSFDSPAGKVIAPEESLKINASANGPATSTLVKFTFTYDVYLGTSANPKKQLLYSDQVATCYLNLSVDKDWAGKTLGGYDQNTGCYYPNKSTDYVAKDPGNRKKVNVYKNLVITNANPGQVDTFGINENSYDGFYAADANGNAYVAFDDETGDVLAVDRFDVKIGENDLDRGTSSTVNGKTVYAGYTQDEVTAKLDPYAIKDANGNVTKYTVEVKTPTHVALYAKDDPSGAVIKSTEKIGEKISSVTVDPALITAGCATAATPSYGINFVRLPKTTAATNVKWLKYDGTTSVKAESYTMNFRGYIGTKTYNLGTIAVTIANTNGADKLQKTYDDYLAEMAPYQPSDYKDYNEKYNSSDTNDAVQGSFKNVVSQIAAPVTLDNADKLVSTTILDSQKDSTTNSLGDIAFEPAKVSAKGDKMTENFYTDGTYYYHDEEHKFPVYCRTYLASATNGVDKFGTKVVKNGDLYYLVNDVQYEKGWNVGSYDYPYYGTTNVPAKNDKGEALYEQVLYQYWTADGKRVNSNDNWTYKFALTHETIKPNDGNEYRGFYTMLEDDLKYNVEQAKKNVDTSLMTLITDEIIADRAGMESVDYKVDTYEKMVQIARNGEALVSVTGVDEAKNPIYATSASSVEIREANRLYKKYARLVEARGYEGNKLEAEINHLTGTTKYNLSATYNEETGVATVSYTGTSTPAPDYGKFVNGVLVNEGDIVYTETTWNNYIVALAKAIIASKDVKSAVAGTYVAKKNVVMAENELDIPAAATTYVVSGVVTEAIDNVGTAGTYALADVAITAEGKKLGKTDSNGAFSVEVPLGVTDVTFTVNGQSRTVSFDGATEVAGAQVGIVDLDFNGDGKINATDAALGSKLNKDKLANVNFKSILKYGVQYNATLD